MITPPGQPVRNDDDVLSLIDDLIAPGSRRLPTLWLFFLDGKQQVMPVIVPIDGIPDEPEPDEAEKLCWIVSNVLDGNEPGGSAVIALTRPGPAVPCQADGAWHDALRGGAAAQGTPIRMICLATPEGTVPLSSSSAA